MTCAEFQKALPYIIETGGNAGQEEHLRTCSKCSDLVADLKYIAECAKLLVPMVDPSPRVWDEINKSLQQEGLVRKATPRGRLLVPTAQPRWGPVAWMLPVAALVLIIAGLFIYRTHSAQTQEAVAAPSRPVPATVASSAPALRGMGDADDQQLLQRVGTQSPSLRDAYETSLRRVNSSIADAQKSLDQNPDDADVQQSLREAYEQKTMLYDMATTQSLP
jgi:hypothetical protein